LLLCKFTTLAKSPAQIIYFEEFTKKQDVGLAGMPHVSAATWDRPPARFHTSDAVRNTGLQAGKPGQENRELYKHFCGCLGPVILTTEGRKNPSNAKVEPIPLFLGFHRLSGFDEGTAFSR